jgi:Cys-rich protein (TIGR01571 family)
MDIKQLFVMEQNLWIPLNQKEGLQIEENPWNNSLCSLCPCIKMRDFCCALWCPCCAWSQEYKYVNALTGYPRCLCFGAALKHEVGTSTIADLDRNSCGNYFDWVAWMSYIGCNLCFPMPCCFHCCLRQAYREKYGIQGGCLSDFCATFVCCCCAHAQVHHTADAARPLIARGLRHAASPCGFAMRLRHAASPCGFAMRLRHAASPCGLLTCETHRLCKIYEKESTPWRCLKPSTFRCVLRRRM